MKRPYIFSLEENKAAIRRMIEGVNKHDLSSVDEFIGSDCIEHTFQIQGPKDFKKFLTVLFTGFPDFYIADEDIIAEGDKVCVRGRFMGTHTGKYYDPSIDRKLNPTGRKISIPFSIIYRIVDGKAVESWTVENLLDFCKQLDIIEFKQ